MALVCLALNAAYLTFDPFRCREIVKDYATKLRSRRKYNNSSRDMAQYKLIYALSMGEKSHKLPDIKPARLDIVFLSGADRWAAIVMLTMSALFFVLHVLTNALIGECVVPCGTPWFWIWWSIFTSALTVSLVMILYGRNVTKKMKEKLDRSYEQIPPYDESQGEADAMQGNIGKLEEPHEPTNSNT